MFTGVVEAVGRVMANSESQLEVESDLAELVVGSSISVDGVCLTVISSSSRAFRADLSTETRRRTTLGSLAEGSAVNLERPLPAGGRLGGHFVQGHVDGVGEVGEVVPLGGSTEMRISLPSGLERYVAEKGSIAVDGVSLTVASIRGASFTAALIPHTLEATTLVGRRPGDRVNLEVDILAKYVEKLIVLERRDDGG